MYLEDIITVVTNQIFNTLQDLSLSGTAESLITTIPVFLCMLLSKPIRINRTAAVMLIEQDAHIKYVLINSDPE